MTFYGEPSQQLLDLLKRHPVGHKWFSFVHGLEPSPASAVVLSGYGGRHGSDDVRS
jgi:hypothetical protein